MSTPFVIVCEGCQRKLRVSDALAGKSVKCPGCARKVTVPAASESAEPAPPPPTKRAPAKPSAAVAPAPPSSKPQLAAKPMATATKPRPKSSSSDDDSESIWSVKMIAGVALLAVLLICAVIYFYPASTPPFGMVSGVVTIDDKPFPAATVVFVSEDDPKIVPAQGLTDDDGNFDLTRSAGKGVAPGKYKVTISKVVMPDGKVPQSLDERTTWEGQLVNLAPANVQDRTTTILRATVAAGKNSIDFPLKGR